MRSLSELAANLQADAVGTLLSGGYLRLYAGGQPSADQQAGGTLLAELRLCDFSTARGGQCVADVKPDLDARADGRANYFTVSTMRNVQVLVGSVGTDDKADLQLNSAEVRRGAEVWLDEFSYLVPKG